VFRLGKDSQSLIASCQPSYFPLQRHKVKSGKKPASEAMTPRAPRGLKDAAPKEEADILSQEEEQENKKVQKEIAAYSSEAPPSGEQGAKAQGLGPPTTEEALAKLGP
ncbi:uncharacterized protein WCI35_013457, partial [Daubentonia madagascariensis]